MKHSRVLIISIAIITYLIGCSLGDKVKIREFIPQGEIESLTTFSIEFSEDLAPDSLINTWLSDELIEFTPRIPGKFKWTSPSSLIFSPDYKLEPMQEYSAEITDKVLYDKSFSLDAETYEFHTPDFDVMKIDFFWTHIPNEYYKASVQANIYFNYPVEPEKLKKYLEVQKDGASFGNYQIVTQSKSDIIAVNFGEIQQTDKEQDFTIIVKKGLISALGKKSLQEDRNFKNELAPITKLQITGVAAGFDGTTGWIEVGTTQMVDEKQLAKYITVSPAKNLSFFVNENQFRIVGDYESTQSVELKIKKGLPGLYGGELEYDFEQNVIFINIEPSINFADKRGKYLMLGGNRNLEVNAVNLNGADIEVSQVFKNNLLHFLNSFSYYGTENYDDEWYYSYNQEYFVGDYGRPLYTQNITLKNRQNWLEKFTVNLDSLLKQSRKGIYVVSVRSTDDRWISDSKMLALTDLGIIAKKSANDIIVFVNSIQTTEPVEGVEVSVISTNNQNVLSGTTDKSGVIRFENTNDKLGDFIPRIITAEKNNDFNYIDLKETFIETSRFDVGGAYEVSDEYNVFIYGDRNLYRPGENMNISAIVRDDKIKIVEEIPVIIKVISPTGKLFDEFKKTLNKEGSFDLGFTIPGYAQTGEYTVEVYSGTTSLIGTYKFSVEEFVPDKIRVALRNDKDKLSPGDKISVYIDAEFLFGAKAADLKYEAHIALRHKTFKSKSYPEFSFNNSSIENPGFEEITMDGRLNAEGKATVEYTVPFDINGSGIITGYAYVSVFDITGRTVNRISEFDIYPKDYYIGIKSHGYYFGTNEKLDFKIIALNPDDKPLGSFTAEAKLVRYEWQTTLKKDAYDKYYYVSEKKELTEWTKTVDLSGGPKNFQFAVSRSGQYELRFSKKGEEEFQKVTFYAYGWASSTAQSFEVDREGRIDIIFDKIAYEPGEKAKILFMCPFSGKMLLTFDRKGVLDYRYVNVENKSTEIEVPVTDDYMPNVYVTATLFKKHTSDNSTPFLVGHGFASMKVEKKKNRLPVTIQAPDKIKPNTTQYITVKTASERNVYVTLAAVDEGILQIKGYKTPDPYGFMYAKKALGVESYDLYKLLLPEIVKMSSSTGGSDEERYLNELKKRTNPVKSKRFKLFAFWSGILKTDGSGIVKVPVKIPSFNGEIRLMAVAYTGARFGSGEKPMKVADDLIIEPEVPRFLSIGDSLVMPVTLINTTGKKGNVKLNLKVEGPLNIQSKSSLSTTVNANSTGRVIFALKADSKVGSAKIILEAGGIANVKEEIDIAVRPVSPLITETGSGTIKGGKEVKIQIPTNFIAGTQNSSLTITKFPAVKFAKYLKSLVGYPYGCIEQTVSKLFPQIYFEKLAFIVAPELYKTQNPVYYVKEGIRKIESMQMYNGAMAYWPGGSYENLWGSVYAAHLLVEARKAGFSVREDVLSKLLSYIASRAKEHATSDYITYEANSRTVRKIASKETIYSLYVLALAGKGDISTMNYYTARPHLLSNDSKYLLAGAYALMGKWNNYYSIIPKHFASEVTERQTGGCFDSEIRANAIMLNVLIEVEPSSKQIPQIIKYLTNNSDKIITTQEQSFAFLALGKAASRTSSSDLKVDIVINGKIIKTFNSSDLTISEDFLNKAGITLKAQGSGEVYYFWSSAGIKYGVPVMEEDSYMKMRRNFYDYRTKIEITGGQFYQGQLLVCKLSLTGFDRSAENIVISDLIPAGFEIENPRLSSTAGLAWNSPYPLNIQYLDVRDDRLLVFTELTTFTREYYYMLRVINQGRFMLPVIAAEAMYDPSYHSYNGENVVHVSSDRIGI